METIISKRCSRCGQLKIPKEFRYFFGTICKECESKIDKKEIIEYLYQIQTHLKNLPMEIIIEFMNKKTPEEIFELYSGLLDTVCFLDETKDYDNDNTK